MWCCRSSRWSSNHLLPMMRSEPGKYRNITVELGSLLVDKQTWTWVDMSSATNLNNMNLDRKYNNGCVLEYRVIVPVFESVFLLWLQGGYLAVVHPGLPLVYTRQYLHNSWNHQYSTDNMQNGILKMTLHDMKGNLHRLQCWMLIVAASGHTLVSRAECVCHVTSDNHFSVSWKLSMYPHKDTNSPQPPRWLVVKRLRKEFDKLSSQCWLATRLSRSRPRLVSIFRLCSGFYKLLVCSQSPI